MRGGVREVELVHARHGYDMEMNVRYLETGDEQTNSGRRECHHLSASYVTGYSVKVVAGRVIKVQPMVDFDSGHHERVAHREGVDR